MRLISNFTRAMWNREHLAMLILGVIVGVLGGYGAVVFRWLLDVMREFCFGGTGDYIKLLEAHTWWYRLLVPTVGGLLVGPFIYFLAREAKGHGVPEVMEAVSLRGGYIRKRVSVVKALASAASIAVGGSVGLEGPFVQIGSGLGSTIGQVFKASPNRMRVLVGCGAAAGIAATFNAPLAGMMFALEIILGEFAISTFSPIVFSAVMATAVSRLYFGDHPAFMVPTYQLVSWWEFALYAILAAGAGVVAVAFTTVLYKIEDAADALPVPEYLKTPLAGLLLGLVGLAFPMALGVGYEGIELALGDSLVWWFMLTVMAVKILASSISLAGGMSGGIFAPSLFMGAMLGGAFGHLVHLVFPEITAGPGAYAIVGMAAVVAGTTHGPLSAFLILFEMTGGYKIILPLMIGCVVATMVARGIRPESIYTLKLLRRGVDLQAGKEMNLLRSMTVEQAMRSDVESVPRDMTLRHFRDVLTNSKNTSFPVVDAAGRLCGIVSHADYGDHFDDPNLEDVVVVGDMATTNVVTVSPHDSLEEALRKISARDFATLPVVDPEHGNRLVGIISHRDIISAYSKQLLKTDLPANQ